jgi:hypothetical protein
MAHRRRPLLRVTALALGLCLSAAPAFAQWQTDTAPLQPPGGLPPLISPPPNPSPGAAPPPAEPPRNNTTVVPRSTPDAKPGAAPAATAVGSGQVSLVALLTQDGQNIEQGLVWRVFRGTPGPDGKARLISTHKEASPSLRLEAGDYIVNVALGRAHLTRKITVPASGRAVQERFVLNAGGLRLASALVNGEAINERAVVYDIYSDERDQSGQRMKVMGGVKPGVVVRLNAGIYNVISTYGDANAIARSDVTVEAGKLTEATLAHGAAKVTFKLVARSGGDAIADTQWTIANALGEVVKESVGALPTHILAPGTYTVSARNAGEVVQSAFSVQAGDAVQVEVVRAR